MLIPKLLKKEIIAPSGPFCEKMSGFCFIIKVSCCINSASSWNSKRHKKNTGVIINNKIPTEKSAAIK